MAPRARAAIAAQAAYAPPREGRTGLRLDFNENLAGCSPAVLAALRAVSAEELARYPEAAEAEREIAASFEHTPASALLTNGVDEAIQLAVTTFLEPGDEAVVAGPTFAMYRFYCEQAGVEVREARYAQRECGPGVREFVLPAAGAEAFTPGARTRAVFIASPNNPTGNLSGRGEILAWARSAPDCLFFVDEAYADFVPPEPGQASYGGLLEAVIGQPNLMVARTFSKAYGLAGVRLGCLFAHPGLMPALRKAHSPYNVNTLALRCGRAAAGDRAWVRAYCGEVAEARGWVEANLERLGLPYWRSAANFVLLDAGARAAELLEGMRARGILIRDRGQDVPGGLRITCGKLAQARAAVSVLEELL